jgi:sugar lactone lactonase YvrE
MLWLVLGVLGAALLIAAWWSAAAPRPEISQHMAPALIIDPATEQACARVDRSADFAANLEQLPCGLPAYDSALFLDNGKTMLVTGHDGFIWRVDLTTIKAEQIANTNQVAWGIRKAPGDPDHVYYSASDSYDKKLPGANPGIFRLDLRTGTTEAVTVRVPDTAIDYEHPVVYADDNPNAPEYRPGGSGKSRAISVADNLDVSADGRRIYFTEPFAYSGATLRDAVDELLSMALNGRLWRHDLDTGATRLIAQGFNFINGVLCDPHPGLPREESVIVTQTSTFRLGRFYVRGPKAGTYEVVLDGLPGTPDGCDRDAAGRIWLALFAARGKLLTWAHAHPWIKPLLMRLPTKLILGQEKRTGTCVVSPDGSTPLYFALHQGPGLASVSSAVPSSSGIYLANIALDNTDAKNVGLQRLKWPAELPPPH